MLERQDTLGMDEEDVEDEEEACSTSNEPSARSEEDAAWAP